MLEELSRDDGKVRQEPKRQLLDRQATRHHQKFKKINGNLFYRSLRTFQKILVFKSEYKSDWTESVVSHQLEYHGKLSRTEREGSLKNVPMEESFQDWLGVGSVMRHFLSWSWPELHRRIICPAGFLPDTILETTIYTIPYYRIPVHSIHKTSTRYRNTSTDYETFLPPLRPEEKCNQFLQPQPTRALLSQTPITHNCSVTETSGWRWTLINQKYGDIQLISHIKYCVSKTIIITFPKQSEKFILPVISQYFYQTIFDILGAFPNKEGLCHLTTSCRL